MTKTELYPYQKRAVDKLLPIKVGALFMDMGTGKTRTAIEFIVRRRKKIDKVIWFCPASIMVNTMQQFKEHSALNVFMFNPNTNISNLPKADVYIVSLESMGSSSRCQLTAFDMATDRTFLIIDESSFIKGPTAKRTKFLYRLGEIAKYRMILTGTPISQGIVDLYSQMTFLSSKILGYKSFWRFAKVHLKYSEKFPGMIEREYGVDKIAKKIAPYVYQITKEECLDLPRKLHEQYYCDLTHEQKMFYEQIKDFYLSFEEEITSYTIFKLFTELQQIVSGYHKRSGSLFATEKLELLKYVLGELGSEKVIIWCHFLKDIENITNLLGGNYVVISGMQSAGEKAENQERFKNDVQYLVATQGAGGFGLNLQFSSCAVYYSNSFKYLDRLQSEDRQHRIGQNSKTYYADLITRNSIDTRIQRALESKGNAVQIFKREIDSLKDRKSKEELIKGL
ncbi:MAG: DEAD/DEAH box helicase [Cyclobacteriaceae bacterium]